MIPSFVIAPKQTVRLYPVEITQNKDEMRYALWNLRTRAYNKGKLR